MRTFIFFVLCSLFSACGSSEYVQIRIKTLAESHSAKSELSPSSTLATYSGTFCKQRQVRILWDVDGEQNTHFLGKPIVLETEMCVGVSCNFANADLDDWLQNRIRIVGDAGFPAPKGKPIEFGIVGALYYPQDSDSDGWCDEESGGVPLFSISIFGYQSGLFYRSQAVTLPIRGFFAYNGKTDGSPSYNPLPVITVGTEVVTISGPFQSCSSSLELYKQKNCVLNDILRLSMGGSGSSTIVKVEYGFSDFGAPPIVHRFPNGASATSAHLFLPNIGPYRLTLTNGSIESEMWLDEFRSKYVNGSSGQYYGLYPFGYPLQTP